ncbi:MAG: YciI family protein [bacterium]|nr:YciI family protein [bacterium]
MKHFLVEVTYTASIAEVEAVVPAHRVFLDEGYRAGLLLMSGPQEPLVGGMVVARAENREAIEAFFQRDPYTVQQVASHRVVEFIPVKHQSFLKDWIGK